MTVDGPNTAVAIGEIRTGLLSNSGTLPRGELNRLLDLVPGEPVRQLDGRPLVVAPYPASAQDQDGERDGSHSAGRTGPG